MKKIVLIPIVFLSFCMLAQEPIIIDHNNLNLSAIPNEWIETAKENLYIGYGHTSHGSQLTSGMNALEAYFTDGSYNWSHTGGPGELHLFEGAGYGTGYLELDCGYAGWDDQTRTYLNAYSDCNVLMWSWCGQVNNVDLQSHYLDPMMQLESEYPDVTFVYMTGHLEGLGPNGSLFHANQQIRDHCIVNNKVLFDFADIEKYCPAADTNYQEYFADDACNYQPPAGGTANWAHNWLNSHPNHELTAISALCGSCSHSVSLNCVKKGTACWYLWARLAGWDGQFTSLPQVEKTDIHIYPNPASNTVTFESNQRIIKIEIFNQFGQLENYKFTNNSTLTTQHLTLSTQHLAPGVYVLVVELENGKLIQKKLIVQR